MDEKELLKEKLKSAISSAVKAISEDFDLEIKKDYKINMYEIPIGKPKLRQSK